MNCSLVSAKVVIRLVGLVLSWELWRKWVLPLVRFRDCLLDLWNFRFAIIGEGYNNMFPLVWEDILQKGRLA